MRTIGLIGGMSWESSLEYYKIINETVKSKLGNLHSAKCIMYSVDFEQIELLQHQEKWKELTGIMVAAAKALKKVGLLGTKFTMEQDFYKKVLKDKFNIDVIIPEEADREVVHKIIYEELCKGILNDTSREKYKEIISKLQAKGAEGVVLGCTEIPLLIKQKDVSVPVFDTTTIHGVSAVEFAIEE